MGRLIDADVLRGEVYSWGMNDYEPSDFTDAIDDAPTVEAIPKADYENRLKADMVAMLEDLRLAIEELDYPKDCDYACNGCLYWGDVDKLIDEKINALRGESDNEDNN